MKGLIFSYRKYCVHDGPGIRMTFFLKGCTLKCRWCHNPEGISPLPEQIKTIRKVGEREFIHIETAGILYSPSEILSLVEKEKVFIEESNGGVTFSGGEPMLQPEFLLETLEILRSHGYRTAVDTSGYAPAESFMKVIPLTDLFLFDIKHLDPSRHIELTGVSNELILSNFRLVADSGKELFVRFPVIPGLNDSEADLSAFRSFLANEKNVRKLSLLPFHKTGASKYERLGLKFGMNGTEHPSAARMQELRDYFSIPGIKVKIGG